ncbi:MAG: hypothetical protein WA823_16925 [Candidatus Acidiferrales bacterium]
MTSLTSFPVRSTKLVALGCVILLALCGSQARAQSQAPSNSSTPATTPATAASTAPTDSLAPQQTPASDAAAKAAERKKRFEEAEKRLEAADGSHASDPAPSDSKPGSPDDISISPVLVNMLIGETQSFSLFDAAGHNLTQKADWSLSNSYVAEMQGNGVPTIVSKDAGTVTVHARVGMRSTDATVTVHPGSSLPIGTIRWQAPPVKGFKPVQIIQAVPTAGVPAQPPQ